jgi:mRNA interferase RelE/StbE
MTWALYQTNRFSKAYKRLHPNQYPEVDSAISRVGRDPSLGAKKKGDLASLYVFKFSCLGQELLLGYTIDESVKLIYLEALGVHENFYRELK